MAVAVREQAGVQIPLLDHTQCHENKSAHDQDMTTLKDIEIDFSSKKAAARSNTLLETLTNTDPPEIHVRQITVKGYSSLGNWTLLVEVLNMTSDLRDVYWSAEKALPRDILTVLETKSPLPKLHYTLSFNNLDPYEELNRPRPIGVNCVAKDVILDRNSVIGSSALYSLKAGVGYGGWPNLRDLNLIFRILSSCPNLRKLSLRIAHGGGCVMSDGQPYAFDFQSHPDVKFPPLEVLSLDGYELDADTAGGGAWDFIEGPRGDGYDRVKWRTYWPWNMLPRMFQDGVDEVWDALAFQRIFYLRRQRQLERKKMSDGKTSLEKWLDLMDWSHLHTLKLASPSQQTLKILGSATLPNLTNIEFDGGHHHAVIDFIAELRTPLESLCLHDMKFCSLRLILNAISQQHTESLKTLRIHQAEKCCTARKTFSIAEISSLIDSCPNLYELEIDMPRPDSTETYIAATDANYTEIVESLALAPELEYISFHYEAPNVDLGGLNVWRYEEYKTYEKYRDEKDADEKDDEDEYENDERGQDESEGDIPDPVIDQQFAKTLFKDISAKKIGKSLIRVQIYLGVWERIRFDGLQVTKRVKRYVSEGTVD